MSPYRTRLRRLIRWWMLVGEPKLYAWLMRIWHGQ